jgi:hypothetical protein
MEGSFEKVNKLKNFNKKYKESTILSNFFVMIKLWKHFMIVKIDK